MTAFRPILPHVALIPLRRIRWGVRAALMLGVAASVVANVLHARDNLISQAIAAWPPLALLLTVELISRVPMHSRRLAISRVVATATIAGIAAWVSYWHMAGVASRYGETGASPFLIPVSVDGLIVVASICLIELGGRIREVQDVAPVDVAEPVMTPFDHDQPIGPEPAPVLPTPSAPTRVRPRSLTASERVTAAHAKHPRASHERLAALADVSVSTVKRHRRTGSSSGDPPAETASLAFRHEPVRSSS